ASSAAPDFEPTGGIVVASGNGARFTAVEVRGPRVQVKQRSDGSWGGTIQSGGKSVPIDANFEGGRFNGSNIRMSIERKEGKTTVVGSFQDHIIRFEVTKNEIIVRTPARSDNYVALGPPGEYGGTQSVHLEGEAQQFPPTPAFALAMLGSFI
ncbi:MAG TPA: hypothetical protein VLQ79_09565, partial [Myxococcaceae bacterium]|nr:hypothetical protein [Myxococcaceae bacterium]